MKNEMDVLLITVFIGLIVILIHDAYYLSLAGVALIGILNLAEVRQKRRNTNESR